MLQVGRGRVEAGLDPQRAALLQAGGQFLALEDFVAAAGDQVEGVLVVGHRKARWRSIRDRVRGMRLR